MNKIEEPEINNEEEDKIAKMFLTQLEEARELISAEGSDVGLCPHCMDIGYLYIERDGYTGVQARVENEITMFNQCFHGTPSDDASIPF
ncbi:hypothetical protein BH09PAT1_BH09PAT1_8570 [soil metagenome]